MDHKLYFFVANSIIWFSLLVSRTFLYMIYIVRSFLEFLEIRKIEDYDEIMDEIFFPAIDKNSTNKEIKERQRKILNLMSTIYWINLFSALLYFAILFLIKEYG